MAELSLPLMSLAILAPWVAAIAVLRGENPDARRVTAMLGSGISLLAALEILREVFLAGEVSLAEPFVPPGWLVVDSLSALPMALFSAVAFGSLTALPRRELRPTVVSAALLLQGATLAAHASANLLGFATAWILSVLAFSWRQDSADDESASLWRGGTLLPASCVCLAIGVAWIAWSADLHHAPAPYVFEELARSGAPGGVWAFGFLVLAALLRKGVFPFHSWVAPAFERGPLMLVVLFINGHLGVYLVARVAIPAFPQISQESLGIVSGLAMLTAIYAAVLALAEVHPRRLLALLAISQASFILAGLSAGTAEGAAGALAYWLVVTVATSSLAAILSAVESRVGLPITGDRFLGLGQRFPRLAVFFVVCGLALVGMPGTLGFCADELLLHGALQSHPQIGFALPLATALNAYHLFRLFCKLFLGDPGVVLEGVPDARPRERWVLVCGLLLLIGGGLFPNQVVSLQERAATTIAAVSQVAGFLPHPH
ncbi:MAG: hypothetical protein GC160_12590 [Acidobacteria bacterium]|nr:hypothetical protein [Acidobacteriota bacterium]